MSMFRDHHGGFDKNLLGGIAIVFAIIIVVIVILANSRVCVEEGDCHDEIIYVTHKINHTTSVSAPQHHRVCECLRYDGDPPRAKKRGM